MQDVKSFTSVFSGLTNVLFTDVGVSKPVIGHTPDEIVAFKTQAIWDTGATGSAITPIVVKALGLLPYKKIDVHTAAGLTIQDVYKICIHLPNELAVNVDATEVPSLMGNFEMLIGMNIIGLGDFSVSNFGGKTRMAFRIPSIGHIDFTGRIDSAGNINNGQSRAERRRTKHKK